MSQFVATARSDRGSPTAPSECSPNNRYSTAMPAIRIAIRSRKSNLVRSTNALLKLAVTAAPRSAFSADSVFDLDGNKVKADQDADDGLADLVDAASYGFNPIVKRMVPPMAQLF